MAQFTGTCTVTIDGNTYWTKDGATLNFGGFERSPVPANGEVPGFTEAPVPSTISATFAHDSSVDVIAIGNTTDATIVFSCDSGVRYMVREAYSTSPPELTGGEGDLTVEFAGRPPEQV